MQGVELNHQDAMIAGTRDAALGLGFQRGSNEQRYFVLGRLTWNNLALSRPRIVAWMTGVRTVGDTLLIECSISDLRYALSTALSPLPCTDATACPAPSHSKAGYASSCAPTTRSAPRAPSSMAGWLQTGDQPTGQADSAASQNYVVEVGRAHCPPLGQLVKRACLERPRVRGLSPSHSAALRNPSSPSCAGRGERNPRPGRVQRSGLPLEADVLVALDFDVALLVRVQVVLDA